MYVLLNDKVLADKQTKSFDNRAFKYGDGGFETIRVIDGKPVHVSLHFDRLMRTLKVLGINLPLGFNEPAFLESLQKVIAVNSISEGGRIRYTYFRSGGGKYSPESNDLESFIEIESLENNQYELNKKGLTCEVCDQVTLNYHQFSAYKTLNSLPYVMASRYMAEKNLDNVLLLNENKRIVEFANANIFLVKGNSVFTPPISEGCIDGVMREVILDYLKHHNFKVYEDPIHVNALQQAEEVIACNSIVGIQWISAIGSKRYLNNQLKDIFNKIF
jgi:branched-chain amino acid aminotransferase